MFPEVTVVTSRFRSLTGVLANKRRKLVLTPDYISHAVISATFAKLSRSVRGKTVKDLLLRSLLVAVLVGPAIGFVSKVTLIQGGVKYEPPVSEAEFHQMRNMTVSEMEATMAKRRIKMTWWDWLRDSVPYSYFWKQVAHESIVPTCGVLLACMLVGRKGRNTRAGG